MKKIMILSIIAVIAIGAVVMANYLNLSSVKFIRYFPKDKLIDLTFEYPKEWKIFERRGAKGVFIQAQIIESKGSDASKKEQLCNIVITIYPEAKAQFSPLNISGLVEDTRKKRLSLKGCELVLSSNVKIAQEEAADDIFSYKIVQIPLVVGSELIPIKERVIYFKKGSNYYTIRLENVVETFDQYNKIFNRVIKSIEFR